MNQRDDAYIQKERGEPLNQQKRLGIAQLLRQMKRDSMAVDVINEGLKWTPGEAQLLELKGTICAEASMYRCALDVFIAKAEHDTASQSDRQFLKVALGPAQPVQP